MKIFGNQIDGSLGLSKIAVSGKDEQAGEWIPQPRIIPPEEIAAEEESKKYLTVEEIREAIRVVSNEIEAIKGQMNAKYMLKGFLMARMKNAALDGEKL